MQQHSVVLGGETRRLRYTLASRRIIENLTGGKSTREVLDSELINDQAALIVAGFEEVHASEGNITAAEANALIEKLGTWLDAHIEGGGELHDIVLAAKRACAESGITGRRFTYDENGNVRPLGKPQAVQAG